jgi:hypothetical protein
MKKPQITNEESVPSDGKDAEGEKMIDELGKKRCGQEAGQGASGAWRRADAQANAGQLIRAAKRRRSETRSTKGRIAVFS